MQHLEVGGAVRPLKWSLGVKWLISMFRIHMPAPVWSKSYIVLFYFLWIKIQT